MLVSLILLSLLPHAYYFSRIIHEDVWLYYHTAEGLIYNVWPYRDRAFGYPPYSLLWMFPPLLGRSPLAYQACFSFLVLFFDVALKTALLRFGFDHFQGFKRLIPFLFFSVTTGLQSFYYAQRFDLIPAALTAGALWSLFRRWPRISGILLAIAIGTKLYPVILLPVLFVGARKLHLSKPFLIGLCIGLFPLLPLGYFLPWWKFIALQANRGFQVESIYASIIWLGHLSHLWSSSWVHQGDYYEVICSHLAILGAISKIIWALSTGGTIILTSLLLTRGALDEKRVALAMTAVLLSFIAFNPVYSPQYLIWLAPLIACLVGGDGFRIGWLLPACAFCINFFYPSSEYTSGFSLPSTLILLTKNVFTILLWIFALKELLLPTATAASIENEQTSTYENKKLR